MPVPSPPSFVGPLDLLDSGSGVGRRRSLRARRIAASSFNRPQDEEDEGVVVVTECVASSGAECDSSSCNRPQDEEVGGGNVASKG